MSKTKSLPKTIYIRKEIDGDQTYFVAGETAKEHGELTEKIIVGEYKLVQTLEVSTEVKAVKK